MFCPECGKYVEKGNFCPYCGRAIYPEEKRPYSLLRTIKDKSGYKEKIISPTIFGIIIICFLLPFVKVSCSGQHIANITGLQLITGFSIEQPSIFGQESKTERVDPQPLIILALFCALLGLILSFIRKRKIILISAIVCLPAIISLFIFKSALDAKILKEGGGLIQAKYGSGYWLVILFFILSIIFNLMYFLQKKE